jgi:adenosine kinase
MAILGIGNPLLDISVNCDSAFLERFEVPQAQAILAEEKHMPLYEEIMKMEPEFIAGGATQNTIRIAQWLSSPNQTAYMGCIGSDVYAERLREVIATAGVKAVY